MKRLLLAILSGLLFALAWPTYGFPGLLFIAFIPLFYLERNIRTSYSKRKIIKLLACAYLVFFIWNFVTTSWLRFADTFGASFAVLVNSLLMTLVILFYHLAAKRTSSIKALIFFSTLWISFEFLHLHWEFSWPWLNLGNAFSEYYKLIQWYEYTGTFGGTLWVLMVNLMLYQLLLSYKSSKNKFSIKKLALVFLIIIIPIGVSLIIYNTYTNNSGEEAEIILLQPNIDPYSQKYDTPNDEISDLFVELSKSKMTNSTDFIIAPETVFARNVRMDQLPTALFKYKLDRYIKDNPNLNILTGVSFIEFLFDEKKARAETNKLNDSIWYNDFNSAIMLNSTGRTQMYHKSKLVVGIENFPYQEILKPIIGDVMIDLGGTVAMKTTQPERGVFYSENEEFRAAPVICYESVYGEYVTEYIRNGANFIAIITNDAWWGETQGHKQHLSYARLRAIETRRQIARSANTGISSFINEKGDITSSMAYKKQGALAGKITTNDHITFYTKAGDYIARISLFVMILLGLIVFFRRPRNKIL